MPTQKLAWKWHYNLSWLLPRKVTKCIHSCKPASPNRPIGNCWGQATTPLTQFLTGKHEHLGMGWLNTGKDRGQPNALASVLEAKHMMTLKCMKVMNGRGHSQFFCFLSSMMGSMMTLNQMNTRSWERSDNTHASVLGGKARWLRIPKRKELQRSHCHGKQMNRAAELTLCHQVLDGRHDDLGLHECTALQM